MAYSLTNPEKETVVILNEQDAFAELSTNSDRVISYFDKLGLAPHRVEGMTRYYRVPRPAVRIKFAGYPAVRIGGSGSTRRPVDLPDSGLTGDQVAYPTADPTPSRPFPVSSAHISSSSGHSRRKRDPKHSRDGGSAETHDI